MNERVRQILDNIRDFWNRYNRRQKTVIISLIVIAVLVVAFVVWLVSRPKWEDLKTCDSYAQVNEVTSLLKESNIAYNIADDALTVQVKKQDLINAKITLGASDIQADGYSLEDALNGSFTTTETDKARKYKAFLESKLSSELAQIDGIKKAYVTINESEPTSIILSATEDSSVAVILVLKSELAAGVGENIAHIIK